MDKLDITLRGGTLVTPDGERQTDIAVAEGKITSFTGGKAREEIDCTGLRIFPGLIDSHVHFNEPGRIDWEGIETGSRALAAGGGTMFFDMPLNAHPPTCDAASFDEKCAAAQGRSFTDFALWGGLVPGNADKLEELSERGVIGFKAFMANSGIEDFACVDDAALREGMKRVAKLGKLVAVHAESESITSKLTRDALAAGKSSVRDYLNSRPVQAELEAIQRAIEIAGESGCALHIVHVSSGAGVALVVNARKQGVDVTCETCPHYLVMTEVDIEHIGALAKCAPPLRARPEQDALWEHLLSGNVTSIGSDHSPSPPEMKRDANFFKVWGGISGVQHTLPLLLTCSRRRKEAQTPESVRALIARLTSFNVAERFHLPPTKGRLTVGVDADLAIVDLEQGFTVRAEELFYRHKQSPYVGSALTGRVVRTILRGQTVYHEGKVVSSPMGRFVTPNPGRKHG